jgi:hypothetical protein
MKLKVAVAGSAVVALVATTLMSTPAVADSPVEYNILVQAAGQSAPDRIELSGAVLDFPVQASPGHGL